MRGALPRPDGLDFGLDFGVGKGRQGNGAQAISSLEETVYPSPPYLLAKHRFQRLGLEKAAGFRFVGNAARQPQLDLELDGSFLLTHSLPFDTIGRVLAPVCRIAARSSSSGISTVVFTGSILSVLGFQIKELRNPRSAGRDAIVE